MAILGEKSVDQNSRSALASGSILRPGETCWRTAHANRFGLIIDAADYFKAARSAMLKAQHSILLVGWDFDLRIDLTPGKEDRDYPTQLGAFLKEIVRRKPQLRIFILKWDMSVVYTMGNQMLPIFALDLGARDSTTPLIDTISLRDDHPSHQASGERGSPSARYPI
jgi:phospholipase D1/2